MYVSLKPTKERASAGAISSLELDTTGTDHMPLLGHKDLRRIMHGRGLLLLRFCTTDR